MNLTKKANRFFTIIIISFITIGLLEAIYLKDETFIYKRNTRSVVEIKAYTDSLISYGSGVVYSDNDEIITNLHVISYMDNNTRVYFDKIVVRLPTQNEYFEVKLDKFDLNNDLALLSIIDPNVSCDFKKITLGNSDKIQVGDRCYALGNINNLSIIMSFGYISSKLIIIENEGVQNSYIQANIDINKGSSGGALLDEYGRLIGITTLRLRDINGDIISGYGYSIPVSEIINFYEN